MEKGLFIVANIDVIDRRTMERSDFDTIMQTITGNIKKMVENGEVSENAELYNVYMTNPTKDGYGYVSTLSDFSDECNDELVTLTDVWATFVMASEEDWKKWRNVIYPYIDFAD